MNIKYIVFILSLLIIMFSCQKTNNGILEIKDIPLKNKIKTDELTQKKPEYFNFSIDNEIFKYSPDAYASDDISSPIEDRFTLDISNFDLSPKKINENNMDFERNIYKQDYFQIYIPDSMYITNTTLRDSVVLKHNEKPALIYLLSPQWDTRSIYLHFNFNYSDFQAKNGWREIDFKFSDGVFEGKYFFPVTTDNYTRYVRFRKTIYSGMHLIVLIYKADEITLEEISGIAEQVMSEFQQFADR